MNQVVTVGVFKAGNKRNVIGESATLELTVRSDSKVTAVGLIGAIEQIAVSGKGRTSGRSPPVVSLVGGVPVTANDLELARRVNAAWMLLGSTCNHPTGGKWERIFRF